MSEIIVYLDNIVVPVTSEIEINKTLNDVREKLSKLKKDLIKMNEFFNNNIKNNDDVKLKKMFNKYVEKYLN